MLIAVCIAPLLAAAFFFYGIPFVEGILCSYFNETAILAPYYLLFDLMLCILAPYLFCFASSMVMLTEYDENMSRYIAVTPVGKKGYIVSRLIFPAIISYVASVVLLSIFSLTDWPLMLILAVCLISCILCIIVSLFIVSFSHNRVEGMALSKLSGFIILGLPAPFFIDGGIQFMLSPLPSYWIAKLGIEQNYLYMIPSLLVSACWMVLLYKRFERKIM